MLDIGFSEVLLIFIIALVVLGPEKLPRLASQMGRWIGRARAMARQFREQLEEEVNLEEVRKAQETKKPAGPAPSAADGQSGTGTSSEPSGTTSPVSTYQAPDSTAIPPDPANFHANTFSHAHPTNEYGANPHTSNGAAEPAIAAPSSASDEPHLSASDSNHLSEEDVRPYPEHARGSGGATPKPQQQPEDTAPGPHKQA